MEIAAHAGRNFVAERSELGSNVFEAVKKHVEGLQAARKRVVMAMWSEGSRERMGHVLAEPGLLNLTPVASWPQALALSRPEIALAVLGVETGFETDDVALISEQDMLGERLVRPRRQSKRAENFIAEVTSLSAGDLVVHVDHGIGRFVGLRAIEAAGRAARLPGDSSIPGATSCSCRSRTSSFSRASARRRRRSTSTGSARPPGRRARRG